jgi:hypothetical protein
VTNDFVAVRRPSVVQLTVAIAAQQATNAAINLGAGHVAARAAQKSRVFLGHHIEA